MTVHSGEESMFYPYAYTNKKGKIIFKCFNKNKGNKNIENMDKVV